MAQLIHERRGPFVELCARTFEVPFECPCCGAVPETELPVVLRKSRRMVASDSADQLAFPYCKRCAEHVRDWDAGSMSLAIITLTGLSGAIIASIASGLEDGLLVLGVALGLVFMLVAHVHDRARRRCGPGCASARQAVRYYGWSGSTSCFVFSSVRYTRRFALQNRRHLVSVSQELRELLESAESESLKLPALDMRHHQRS